MSLSVIEVLPYVQIVAGVATGLGFFFTYLTFRRIRKTEQLKLADKLNDSLLALDKELSEIKKGDKEALSLWDSRRFNTLEWYSFLVNENQITDKKLQKYFEDVIIYDYENYFLKDASEEAKNDPEQYPEFKKLYKRLKGDRQTSPTPISSN